MRGGDGPNKGTEGSTRTEPLFIGRCPFIAPLPFPVSIVGDCAKPQTLKTLTSLNREARLFFPRRQ